MQKRAGAKIKNFMTTQVQITKIGENFMLPLPADLLDKLGVQDGGEIEISTSGDSVILRSLQAAERRKLIEKYTTEIFEEHREVLQALAEGAK